jgi:hypothetical protein
MELPVAKAKIEIKSMKPARPASEGFREVNQYVNSASDAKASCLNMTPVFFYCLVRMSTLA